MFPVASVSVVAFTKSSPECSCLTEIDRIMFISLQSPIKVGRSESLRSPVASIKNRTLRWYTVWCSNGAPLGSRFDNAFF